MKLFFCDIDGTFQDLGQPIPEVNKQAVKCVQDSGNHFVFVTGRGLELVDDLLYTEGISCDVIYGNGAGIKHVGEVAKLSHPLHPTDVKAMIHCLEKHHIYYFIHTTAGVFGPNPQNYEHEFAVLEQKLHVDMAEDGDRIYQYKRNYFYNECQRIENLDGFLGNKHREIIKIEMMDGDDAKLQKIVNDWQQFDTLIFQSYTQTLEVVNTKATKGAAITEYMTDYQGSTSYGIGDGENDWAMFEAVDISVAVANAALEIQEACSIVIGPSSTGSVGQFILNELAK